MEKDEKYELLRFQIKTLQLMLSSVIDEDKFAFYNFIIDHNIPEEKVRIILKSLGILKDRIFENRVSIEIKELYGDIECLKGLFEDKRPSFNEYENFIQKYVCEKLNAKYLLLSLKRQGIHIGVCDYLLEDMKNNK